MAVEVKPAPAAVAESNGSGSTAASRTPNQLRRELVAAVGEAAQRLRVPGVAVGVIHGDVEHHVTHGVTSVTNPLEVTDDTLFQIGSTGKTFTATAVMRLVEDGRVDLDAPVRTYVPELKLRDEGVAQRVTVLQLLNHTAGWDGDFFEDQGDGDDALAKYVKRMRTLKQVFQPGSGNASYNNAALALAGRLIEKVTATTYEKAMRSLVLDPVGLPSALYAANEIMVRRFAVGHVNHDDEDGKPVTPHSPWRMLRAANPMGGMSADRVDTLEWARFHLGDGTNSRGERVLSAETLRRMQQPTARLPIALGDNVGISWLLKQVGPVLMVGHGGTTEGQLSAFQMVPERDFAVVINTNSTNGGLLHRELLAWVLREYLGVEEPEDEALPLTAAELAEYAGTYASDTTIYTIKVKKDHLVATGKPTPLMLRMLKEAGQEPPKQRDAIPLKLLADDICVVSDGVAKGIKGEFQRDDSGDITGLNFGGRLAVRR